MKIPTKDLELWLLGWSESHSGGCKVTFQVSEEDLAYFRAATVRKGKHAGQRYAAVLVQLNDDDQPDPESVTNTSPPKGSSPPPELLPQTPAAEPAKHKAHFPAGRTGLAVRWCLDENFQQWVSERFADQFEPTWLGLNEEEVAKKLVCKLCAISSRNELDTSDGAAILFDEQIRWPYKKYLEETT